MTELETAAETAAEKAAEKAAETAGGRTAHPRPATSTTVTVRYFAAAAEAAAAEEERIELPPGSTLADLLDSCEQRHGAELVAVLARSSFLLDAVAAQDRTAPLGSGQIVDILPPFAGG